MPAASKAPNHCGDGTALRCSHLALQVLHRSAADPCSLGKLT